MVDGKGEEEKTKARVRARTRDVQASVISRSVTRRNSIFDHIHPFPLFPSSAKKSVLSDRLMNIICDRNFSYFGAEQTDPTGHFYATMAPTPSFSLSFSLSLSLSHLLSLSLPPFAGVRNGEQFREESAEFNAYLWASTQWNELKPWPPTSRVRMYSAGLDVTVDRSRQDVERRFSSDLSWKGSLRDNADL